MRSSIKLILLLALILLGYNLVLRFALAAPGGPVPPPDPGVIGKITTPDPLSSYGNLSNSPGGGLVGFASNLIKLIMVLAGIWSFLNIIFAGFNYITQSTNPEAIANANKQIYMSLLGLVIIVCSFALAGIFGWLLFGNASAILVPRIYGPGT